MFSGVLYVFVINGQFIPCSCATYSLTSITLLQESMAGSLKSYFHPVLLGHPKAETITLFHNKLLCRTYNSVAHCKTFQLLWSTTWYKTNSPSNIQNYAVLSAGQADRKTERFQPEQTSTKGTKVQGVHRSKGGYMEALPASPASFIELHLCLKSHAGGPH